MNNEPIVVECTYDAPVAKVWLAITDKEEMKEWYFDLDEFKHEVDFEFSFTGKGQKGQKYVHLCKITQLDPLTKLQYSWRYKDFEGNSYVSFELFDEEGGTRLKLTHSGVESFPNDNPDFAKESFEKGWNELIGTSLKKYLQS